MQRNGRRYARDCRGLEPGVQFRTTAPPRVRNRAGAIGICYFCVDEQSMVWLRGSAIKTLKSTG